MQILKSSMETHFPDIPVFQESCVVNIKTLYEKSLELFRQDKKAVETISNYFSPGFFSRKPNLENLNSEHLLLYLTTMNLIDKYKSEYLSCLLKEIPNRNYFYYEICQKDWNDFSSEQQKLFLDVTKDIINKNYFYTSEYPKENFVSRTAMNLFREKEYELFKTILTHPLFKDSNVINTFLEFSKTHSIPSVDYLIYLIPYINFIDSKYVTQLSRLYCKNVPIFNRNLIKYLKTPLNADVKKDWKWNFHTSIRIVAEKCLKVENHDNLKLENPVVSYDISYTIENSKNFQEIAHIFRVAEINNCKNDLVQLLEIPSLIKKIINLIGNDNNKLKFFLSEL